MLMKAKKLFTLLTAMLLLGIGNVLAQPALPATTLTLPNIPTEGWKGSVTPTYYKAAGSNVYVFNPFELYSSVANLTWTTQNSGGSTSATPAAMAPFPASSVFTGYKAATLNNTSKGPYAYRVTNCVAAYIYIKSGSDKKRTITLAAYEIDGEGEVASSAAASNTYEANSDGVISISLSKDKEYYIKVSQVGTGSGGSSSGNSSYYMLGLQAPFKVTLDPDGGAYPSNTLSGWTYDDVNDKYIKYVEAGSLTLPEGPAKGGFNFVEWQDNQGTAFTAITISKDTTLTAQWISSGVATHGITYTNTKGASTTGLPTEYYEGTGIASFDPLEDVTDFHFIGWNPASIANDATTDQEIEAQWVAAYNVTFSAGDGTGTVPSVFQKWEGAKFNLPGQGEMVAPSGKAFDGWKANGAGDKLAANAEYTMTAAAVEFVAQWKAAPTVLFHWRSNTGSITMNATNGTTLGGTTTLRTTDDSKTWGNESATYKASVASDMKGETSGKELKPGGNANYLELTLATGSFQEGDTIIVAGYNNWGFTTTTEGIASASTWDVADVATGVDKNNVDTGYAVIEAGVDASTIYARRKNGASSAIAAIKVIRPVKYAVNFAAGTGASGSMAAKEYPAGAEVTLPECTFTAPTDQEFDAWTSSDVTITAGKFTMPANDVTITATWKAETPKYDIVYHAGANGTGSIAAAKKTKDIDFVLSSERFTRAGYLQTGWATEDGGAQAYALGATYTANEALDLYPVWTELTTYVAEFACGDAAPAGWTFSTDDGWSDSKTIAAYVCKFVENGLTTPKTTTGDGTSDDDVAFAKNTDAIATYDLGIATTVAALNVTLNGGSSSAFNETIEYIGADGTTVKKEYTTSLNAGNWKDNAINKTDIVEDVRYIRVHGATKWVVMKDFSVQYIETRPQYNVEFAAGTYGTGTMATRKYIEAATVTAPDCGFGTSDATKEFDKWAVSGLAGVTELAAGETFAMPTNTVTLTALWRVATTKYTVTYYDGATELGSEEVAEGSNPAEYATYQDKANHVFLGWFNDADLAPAHAVDDISAEVIDAAANYYGKWALDLQVTKIVFSNGFDAFIDKDAKTVKAYYMSGESAPTMTSYEANANVKADGVTIVGNKVVLTGTDDSEIEYDLTIEAVTPLTTLNALQTFDGSEAYVKAGLAYDGGWKFRKNADDGRIPKGYTRIYFFVRGGAEKATFTSCATKRNVKIYVNNVETSVTETAASGSTFDVPLDPADANNMIAIVSNQTSGDGGVGALELVASAPTPDYERTGLEVGRYYTICLPKKVVAATGATFWSMSERNTDTENPLAYIVEENLPLTAGQPFLFQATATTLEVTYEGEATTAGSHGALHGTLDAMDQAALDAAAGANTLYILKNNELRLASGRTGNSLAANRAYIIYEELDPVSTPSHAPGRQVRSMPLHKDVATGLDDLNADNQAQKVLLNGQLFIIRGEKMYDATGILVK